MEQPKVDLYGKVAKFPKNTKASKAYNFLENVKISKKKLWYFIIEKDTVTDANQELQMIKYNNKKGVDCTKFLNELKRYYDKDEQMYQIIEKLVIDGNDNFSIIRNIPNIEINGEKIINKLTKDLIKLLYK